MTLHEEVCKKIALWDKYIESQSDIADEIIARVEARTIERVLAAVGTVKQTSKRKGWVCDEVVDECEIAIKGVGDES